MAPAGFSPPAQLEEYRIVRPLGHGAMGRVYLAHDTLLDRPVAIKFLAHLGELGVDDDAGGLRERFFVEARAVARLSHPNVVAVYRVGEWRGRPYLVSELVRGQSLDRLSKPLPWRRVLTIGIGLCRGLAAAHRRRVLHRDIKPANAMLTADGDVKLLDFGLAKLLESPAGAATGLSLAAVPALRLSSEALASLRATTPPTAGPAAPTAPAPPAAHAPAIDPALGATLPRQRPATPELAATGRAQAVAPRPAPTADRPPTAAADEGEEGPALTRAGDVLGSPLYMAPEMWRGEPPTRQSDIYSLGTVLYELCAGRAPHDGATLDELPVRAQEVDAAPLASLVSDVDERFAAAIDRCLRRQPERRFESAEALLVALEELAEGPRDPAATVNPDGNPYRGLQSFDTRHRGQFFGRDAEVRVLLERLRAEPLVVVTGDSGVGKSSLCQAGVLTAVAAGALGGEWRVLRIEPGRRPLGALAAALAGTLARDEGELLASLRSDPQELVRLLRRRSQRVPRPARLLLYIDPLEALFTQADPGEREATGRALRELTDYAPDWRLLGSVRSDFLSRLAALPGLGEEIGRALFLLGPLDADGLRQSIVRPAMARGFRFEEGLTEQLVASASETSGALPLLQFTLAALWEARDRERHVIPQRALDDLGGVGGALARYADGVLDRMLPAERRAARTLLGALVSVEGTRTRRSRLDLLGPPDDSPGQAAARQALEALVRARLLTVHAGSDELGTAAKAGPSGESDSLYELAHEALLSSWDTLRGFLARDVERRAARQRLAQAAADWERLQRPRELLWQAPQLRELMGLLSTDESERELPPRDAAFLRQSRRASRLQRAGRLLLIGGAPLLGGLVWVGAYLRANHALRQQAAGQLAEARGELSRAREIEGRAEAGRAQALAAFDRRQQAAGERLWSAWRLLDGEVQATYRRAGATAEAAFILRSGDPEIRDTLAAILTEQARRAEAAHRTSSRDELLARVWLLDSDGKYRQRWQTPARLDVTTRPVAATVTALRIDAAYRLHPEEKRELGTTPLTGIALPPGGYLLQLTPVSDERRLPVRLPILVGRGETLPVSVELPRASDVPPGFVYVPAGRALFGSDADDSQRRDFFYHVPLHNVVTGPFLIARHETTYGDWLDFLRHLPPAERERRRPRAGQAGGSGSLELFELPDGAFELLLHPSSHAYRAREGAPLPFATPRRPPVDWRLLPVTGVSTEDAAAYLAWLRDGGRVPGARLCSEAEWERAARGADERPYPHGDRLLPEDAAFDGTYGQDPAAMGPDLVGSHPASRSLFGIDDLVGNAFEWVSGSVSDRPFALRGGAYYYGGRVCRLDNRHESEPTLRDPTVGLRVCATPRGAD